jgi:hypothetical protein
MNGLLLHHKLNDRIWQTQIDTANVVVIWIGFEDDILDIEAYALGNLPFSNNPQKLFVLR